MEKKLKPYHHRQIVLNFYEDDMLYHREGFMFEHLEWEHSFLHVIKDGKKHSSIDLSIYHQFFFSSDFKNHYVFQNEQGKRIEIYFP